MRILLTIPDLDAAMGGPSVLVTRLASALVEAGHSVALLCGQKPATATLPVPKGVEALIQPWHPNPWQRYRQFRSAVDAAIRKGVEVVHDHGLWLPENAASASAALAKGVPWIAQPCGMLQTWPLSQQRLKKRLAWMLYQRHLLDGASAIIAASSAEARETSAHLARPKTLHCIAHGVDLPAMSNMPRKRQAVFLGRLHPVKQVDLLLTAWAALNPAGWGLRIAGSGAPEYEATLRQQARTLGLEDTAIFLGHLESEAKQALLSESQLAVQPSRQENFGLSVVEALAHGLPVLTTQNMPWTTLPAAGCGWSVTSDLAGIQEGLRVATDLSLEALASMGSQARTFASRYSWTEAARQTELAYVRALKAH